MEARILDLNFDLVKVIDAFESFIWTERYAESGDFELYFAYYPGCMYGIKEGRYITTDISSTVMIIDSIEQTDDADVGKHITVTGRTLDSIMERRVIKDKETCTCGVETALIRLVNKNIGQSAGEIRQVEGFTVIGSGDNSINNIKMEGEYHGENLYKTVSEICLSYGVGMRVIADTGGGMMFQVYQGADRSKDQYDRPPVVFSREFDNIRSTEEMMDYSNYKNSGFGFSKGSKETYTDSQGNEKEWYSPDILASYGDEYKGFDRYEIFIKSSIRPDPVDREQFGKAQDRVSKRDYQERVLIHFDSAAYENDRMESWSVHEDMKYRPQDTPSDEQGWKDWMSHLGYRWSDERDYKVKKSELLDEIDEEDFSRYTRSKYGYAHTKRDYETWGWTWKEGGESDYNAALSAADAEIQAEYMAAVNVQANIAKGAIREEVKAELTKYGSYFQFAFEVDDLVQFHYGRDYFLGDVVTIESDFGSSEPMRVVEVVCSQDSNGFNVLPSFNIP